MTNIEYDLKEILIRLEGRFDKLEGKIDKIGTDVADLKIKMAEILVVCARTRRRVSVVCARK